jgi:hypothetical protein
VFGSIIIIIIITWFLMAAGDDAFYVGSRSKVEGAARHLSPVVTCPRQVESFADRASMVYCLIEPCVLVLIALSKCVAWAVSADIYRIILFSGSCPE